RRNNLIVALQRPMNQHLGRDVGPHQQTAFESHVIHCLDVGRVHQRQVEAALVAPKGHHLVFVRQLPGKRFDHLGGNVLEILRLGGRHVALLAEEAGEELLGDKAVLYQVGAELPSVDQLSVECLFKLLSGEYSSLKKHLADAEFLGHLRESTRWARSAINAASAYLGPPPRAVSGPVTSRLRGEFPCQRRREPSRLCRPRKPTSS